MIIDFLYFLISSYVQFIVVGEYKIEIYELFSLDLLDLSGKSPIYLRYP